jgi:hypothetical protein
MGEDERPWRSEIRELLKPIYDDAKSARAALGTSRPELVYHYTNAAGLRGILESQVIWASNALFLNDRSELSYVNTVVGKVAAQLKAQAGTATAESLIATLRESGWREPYFEQQYVACFSAVRDSLSQWRAYAGDGLGYAIGLDASARFRVRGTREEYGDLVRVIYDAEEQSGIVQPFVKRTVDAMNRCMDGQQSLSVMFEGIVGIIGSVSVLGVAIKNGGFREENEWRLVVTDHKESPTGSYMKYRSGSFGITPYIELEPTNELLPIREVVLGPRLHDPHARTSARGILSHYGYQTLDRTGPGYVPVIHSEATYRGGGA